MELDVEVSLNDDAVTFLSCPGDTTCCSFTATERHFLFGDTSGAVALCARDPRGLSVLAVLSPAELSSTLRPLGPCDPPAQPPAMIDCLCASPFDAVVSILHRRDVLTFAVLEPDGLRPVRSVPLGRPYTNRAAAHSWLRSGTFLVGCLDGTVLAVETTSSQSEPPRALLRETSPIVQLSVDGGTIAVSSVLRSAVALLTPGGELSAHTIGTRVRAEGMFGACPYGVQSPGDARPVVYAARHNARIFEAAADSGVVARTFHTPSGAELGVLKPLPAAAAGDVVLWSEGTHFVSVLRLGQTCTQHVTRRFTDAAVVCSAVLAREVIALCSDGRLMCVPLPSGQQDEEALVKEGEYQKEEEEEKEGTTNLVRRTKLVKRKVIRVVRRPRSQQKNVADELQNETPIAGNDNKVLSSESSLLLQSTNATGQQSDTRSEEALDGEVAAMLLETIHSEECVPPRVIQEIGDTDEQSNMGKASETPEATKVGELDDFVKETVPPSSYQLFRAELNRLIRLFDVRLLRVDAHSDLYAAVRAFLPLLEEQLLDAVLLLWSSHDAMQPGFVFPTVDATQAVQPLTEAGEFFNTEESTVSSLSNVLKSALTWSIRSTAKAAKTLTNTEEGTAREEEEEEEEEEGEELRWKEPALVLHMLLVLPWPPACSAEDRWAEKMSVLEHTVARCGTDPDFIPFVLALSNAVTTQVVQTRVLPALLCGHERCAVAMECLRASRRAELDTVPPGAVAPLLGMLERDIIEQSLCVLDDFEESPYPACTFFAYFPYVFAIYPSKATLLALRHYPGVSVAYFEWALSDPVQSFVYQSLRDISANEHDKYKNYSNGNSRVKHITVARPLTRLSPEDLADSLADLVLALCDSARTDLSATDAMPCVRILLQRRFALLRWAMEAQRTRVLSLAAGDASSGDAVSVQVAQRKIHRLEDSAIEVLCSRVPVAVAENNTRVHDVLDLLDELEFPEGIAALSWTREYIARFVTLKRLERLLPLFQLPQGTAASDWVFLFQRAHEAGTLETAMLFCLTVEREAEHVMRLLETAFPSLLTGNGAVCEDAQLAQVARKLRMLC